MNRRDLAREVASLIESVSPFIEDHTRVVCPSCPDVCCINRHSYHDNNDLAYLQALEENVPAHRSDVADSDPCQFIGDQGCTLRRTLRPYRCTWYFCTPLLDSMHKQSARRYRNFMHLLHRITGKRMEMMEQIAGSAEIPDY